MTIDQSTPQRDIIQGVTRGIVQLVALKRGALANLAPAWTGSGTMVHPAGIIVTSCQVANPRALGIPSPDIEHLGVAVAEGPEQEPVLTYFAEIVAQSAELDLAVLRITSALDGTPVGRLELCAVRVGDSDKVEPGDKLSILGYPGVGGETVSLSTSNVSGFARQEGVANARAWIKGDAIIGGGFSGGAAVDREGRLVGIPMRDVAGMGQSPVDARPVRDFKRDDHSDHHALPLAIDGFIHGLRPVNLAKPLLTKAKGAPTRRRPRQPVPSSPSRARDALGPRLSSLVFSANVTQEGLPVGPAEILAPGCAQVHASFNFDGMGNGVPWQVVWAHNGNVVRQDDHHWDAGERGRTAISLNSSRGLSDGRYYLGISVGGTVVAEGEVAVGSLVGETETQIAGSVVDAGDGRCIEGALVIALKPGIRARQFVRTHDREMAYASARTDAQGRFVLPNRFAKGQVCALVVVASGYRDAAIDGAIRLSASAPELGELPSIALQRD